MGYLKEKGITHDTKTEIFKMTDDLRQGWMILNRTVLKVN